MAVQGIIWEANRGGVMAFGAGRAYECRGPDVYLYCIMSRYHSIRHLRPLNCSVSHEAIALALPDGR